MNKNLGEFEIIKTYFSNLTITEKGAFNLTDDAAVLQVPPGKSFVVTTDTLVEGIHFLENDMPGNIASKLLRVSLSDLAAMGSIPAYYNLSIALNSSINQDWFKAFSNSLLADQEKYDITLIGGDTVSTSGPLTLTVTAMGFVDKGKIVRRGGAKCDDDIWVSGSIGDAALGLKAATGKLDKISEDSKNYLMSRYFKPNPRTLLGPKLVNQVNSAIDISDGLIADLNHICETSNLGAKVKINDIPLSFAATEVLSREPHYIDLILGGGDDFELLFTADKSFRKKKKLITNVLDIKLTRIGTIVSGSLIEIFDRNGNLYTLPKSGYTHF
jgi:thiamine-monophosphate kinase